MCSPSGCSCECYTVLYQQASCCDRNLPRFKSFTELMWPIGGGIIAPLLLMHMTTTQQTLQMRHISGTSAGRSYAPALTALPCEDLSLHWLLCFVMQAKGNRRCYGSIGDATVSSSTWHCVFILKRHTNAHIHNSFHKHGLVCNIPVVPFPAVREWGGGAVGLRGGPAGPSEATSGF